jgi:hypothetical protein
VTGICDFELREFFNVSVHHLSETTQQSGPVRWGHATPSARRLLGTRDCLVGLFDVNHFNVTNDFFR